MLFFWLTIIETKIILKTLQNRRIRPYTLWVLGKNGEVAELLLHRFTALGRWRKSPCALAQP
jgi:hypothetical protein